MLNYRIVIEYDGTDFHGWQLQHTGRTIQGELEQALLKLTGGNPVRVYGAGRTDAGVHARGQVANFQLERKWDVDRLMSAINGNLGNDVWVKRCDLVPNDFHARYSAVRRMYQYFCRTQKSVIDRRTAWNVSTDISVYKLRQCTKFIIGEIDFTSFCKLALGQENRRCVVYQSEWNKHGDFVIFKMEANRFLQHLIRYLVGTMIEVAKGRLTVIDFRDLLQEKNPQAKVWKAPACGLFLERVSYT